MIPLKSLVVGLILLGIPVCVQAQQRPEFEIQRAETPPVIDGVQEDAVWATEALPAHNWLSYNPLYGEEPSQPTEVRIAYDDRNLYFLFHCIDNEPDKIRTTISRRDSVFNDDWIGFSLDSTGSGQVAYHLFVNPSGIQMDALNTSSAGERFEADFVWESAGRVTDDGYFVEIKLPLRSIRFAGGEIIKMGTVFWRRISRMGVSWAWPDLPPGQWVFNRHAQLVFRDLEQPLLLELLPSITYSRTRSRGISGQWNDGVGNGEAGLSVKYGITGSITLDATVNPDFSQVESDAFQVQVNERFPTFFSEKRPFFLEGIGLFSVAGSGGDGNMRAPVHTRRIIDPAWGARVTGTSGKVTFGLLSAVDDTPEELRGVNVVGNSKTYTIGRAMYGLGESNYAGALVTHTQSAGRKNRVIGGDVFLRFARGQQLSVTALDSHTGTAVDDAGDRLAGQVSYSYNRRSFVFSSQVEHYDRGFQMDTAFYNRTGFTSGWTYTELNYFPPNNNSSWIKRITPFTWNKVGRDRVQGGDERFGNTGVRMNFTRQGFFRFHRSWGKEPWAGQEFKNGRYLVTGNVQILRWLNVNGNINWGWATFYDPVAPFQGKSVSRFLGVTLQPDARINQNLNFNTVRFTRAETGEPVYTVHVANSRTTYQFSKQLFSRAIVQYDSGRKRILFDLLTSYEVAPGTVFHAGYGALMERRDSPEYLTVNRGLFLKASYAHRF